jgi:hypothetical protein
MKISSVIYMFFEIKEEYSILSSMFDGLGFDDCTISKVHKSPIYNETDFRFYEAIIEINLDNYLLCFNVVIEDVESDKLFNVLELRILDEETFDYVHHNSKKIANIFGKVANLENLALVTNDETAPGSNFYQAFKKGDFNDYLLIRA